MRKAAGMYSSRRLWLALLIVVAALIVLDVAGPRIGGALPRSPLVAYIVVGLVFAYIVGAIVLANNRLRLPRIRRPRRVRPVRRDPGSASRFIDEFERRNRR